MSDTVLGVLKAETLHGPAYTGGRSGIGIRRANFGANVLCRRHNSDLSPLDANAQLLFLAQRLFWAEVNKAGFTPEDEQVDVSGDRLERWLLKTLVTHTMAKIFTARGSIVIPPNLDQATELVFGDSPWPTGWGLWMKHRPEIVLDLSRDIEFAPIRMARDGSLGGGGITIGGLEFWLSLFLPTAGDGGPFDGAVYRPSGIIYRFPGFKKIVGLHWRDGALNPSISCQVRVTPSQDKDDVAR